MISVDDIKLDGEATVEIIQRCGAGEIGQRVTVPGRQARMLVVAGYGRLVETAAKPQPVTRGKAPERRG
jgi:hypothetical protein